ncbi:MULTISPECIES: hypothetical protein [Nocardiopsidaceae]|uniref:Uncharacterized protein n=1 Tax=Streptomonospora nanhaiensis TaxID=1323731 RepID=A0ABY6YKH2_9ACTN|nr:hypothetical protein [Streptomonospora nanhaiensis]WAE72799.1 hypothetical protein OUQ99_27085 [Streptomonospora nanhaiensis]
MAKRRTDWGSFVAGLLFLSLAVAFAVRGTGDWEFDVVWVLPALAVGLGVAGVARVLTRRSRKEGAVADGPGGAKD